MREANCLLVIDLQKGINSKHQPLYDLDNLLNRVNQRINSYKNQNLPIVIIQHVDEDLIYNSESWQLFEELKVPDDAFFLTKTHANSFYKTDLKELLETLNVKSIEVCGAQTEYCIDTTIRFAHGLDYVCSLVEGLHTTTVKKEVSPTQFQAYYEKMWNQRFLTLLSTEDI